MTSYGDRDLGQHCRLMINEVLCIHLIAISQKILKVFIVEMSLKFTSLRLFQVYECMCVYWSYMYKDQSVHFYGSWSTLFLFVYFIVSVFCFMNFLSMLSEIMWHGIYHSCITYLFHYGELECVMHLFGMEFFQMCVACTERIVTKWCLIVSLCHHWFR